MDLELSQCPFQEKKSNEVAARPKKVLSSVESARRGSITLLGEDIIIDDWLDWRLKWAQRGTTFFSFCGLLCFVLSGYNPGVILLATIVFAAITLVFFGLFYFKNCSFPVFMRILKEPNVIVIVILAICNLLIEIFLPNNSFSWILGLLYGLIVMAFVFMDI